MKKGPILLANSSEQNLCEKICSYRGAKLDENRTSTPTNSTIMQSIGAVCRLVVISPAVSDFLYEHISDVRVAACKLNSDLTPETYSITRAAWARSDAGISTPIALAVLRLSMRS